MSIFVNRILDLKKIKAIGFDMDHTLVRYYSERFERLAFKEVLSKLVRLKKYPKEILKLKFSYHRVIRGLILDKEKGNLIKLSVYGRVKTASHGLKPLTYKMISEQYHGRVIDISDPNYESIDTSFSVGETLLFAQLINLKDKAPNKYPTYMEIYAHVRELLDLSHQDNSLKGKVLSDLKNYILRDPETVRILEKFRAQKKILMLITNAEYPYTKALLDFAITPYLKKYKHWSELFHYVITLAEKPSFFRDEKKFFSVDPETELLRLHRGHVTPGIYMGGSARRLMKDLDLNGDEILYIGDHIYGDILQLKKINQWRTALVVEEIDEEREQLKKAQKTINQMDKLMNQKMDLELSYNDLDPKAKENKKRREVLKEKLKKLDEKIQKELTTYNKFFNPYWGEIMRSGLEESLFMGQVRKYACIYMGKISDLYDYSPRHYFRPKRKMLPHEEF